MQPEPRLRARVQQRGARNGDVGPGRRVVAVVARHDHGEEVHAAAQHDDDQRAVVARRAERDLRGEQLRPERRDTHGARAGHDPPPGEAAAPAVLLRGQFGGDHVGLEPQCGLGLGGAVPQQFLARTGLGKIGKLGHQRNPW
jgi:hypothetical protein